MIIKKELSVSNKKKDAIVTELRSLNFKPFAKPKKTKAAGETEAVIEEEDQGMASDYDYLLGMALWSLTAEKVSCGGHCLLNQQLKYLRSRDCSPSGMAKKTS